MREFVKQIVTALKDDDWEILYDSVRHTKSRLVIGTEYLRIHDLPYSLTWWERRRVRHHINKMLDRQLAATLIIRRVEPKLPSQYGSDKFI
jgi:hypothetical protein